MVRNRWVLLAIPLLVGAVVAGCNLYYYNPNRGVEMVYGGDGQLLLDMWAFTELHSPGYSTNWADCWRDGPGSYQVRIRQHNMFWGTLNTSSEHIVRGKMRGNDDLPLKDYWNFPIGSAFGYREGSYVWIDEQGTEHRKPSEADLHWQLKALRQLPASTRTAVYVTFASDLSLAEFLEVYERWDDLYFNYAAVVSADGYIANTIGFSPQYSGIVLENVPEGYPNLRLLEQENQSLADVWESQFTSLLTYLSGRSQFLDAMVSVNGIGADYYKEISAYIQENGVNIYGVLIHGDTEEIISFLEQESPFDFYVNDVKLSVFS